VSASSPAVTGHSFKVDRYDVCLKCHPYPEQLAQFANLAISNTITQVKADLDTWAETKAPSQLWTKYGTRAWEYSQPGSLSPGGQGPTAAEQALIPDNIRKARYNLYVVISDGSYGVHNGQYAVLLLNTAENWIYEEFEP
jgi:hypothetical protein